MSGALWCDVGGHAFSRNDPAKSALTLTRTVEVDGRRRDVDIEMDACGPHSASSVSMLALGKEADKRESELDV